MIDAPTLNGDEALAALQALVRDIGIDVSAVQWGSLAGRPGEIYRVVAAGLPAKLALATKLTAGTHLDDEYVAGMLRRATRDGHNDRCDRLSQPYDIDAAMAIDPASILTPAGDSMTAAEGVITPAFTAEHAIAAKHALEDRAAALEAKPADLPWLADIITNDLRRNLSALLALLVAMGYSPETQPRRGVAARLKELDA